MGTEALAVDTERMDSILIYCRPRANGRAYTLRAWLEHQADELSAGPGVRRTTVVDLTTPSTGGPREHGWLIAAGLFFAADLATWHIAIGMTTVANATLLANLAPLFVAPVAWLLWRERVNRTFLFGLLLSLAGTAILMGEGLGLHRERLVGDAISVLAAAFYAGYLLLVSHLRRHDHSAMRILSWSSATVAVVLLPAAWLAGETILPQSPRGWALLAGLAMLSHVGGQGLITYSMATLPASFSAVGLLIQPLAAAVLAWMLLTERFGVQQALAGAVILGGILLCRLASRPASARNAST